jgi:hypothetical protein
MARLLVSSVLNSDVVSLISFGVACVAFLALPLQFLLPTRKLDHCRRCLHDLRGTRSDHCSECGARLATKHDRTARVWGVRWRPFCGWSAILLAAGSLWLLSGYVTSAVKVAAVSFMSDRDLVELAFQPGQLSARHLLELRALDARSQSYTPDGSIDTLSTVERIASLPWNASSAAEGATLAGMEHAARMASLPHALALVEDPLALVREIALDPRMTQATRVNALTTQMIFSTLLQDQRICTALFADAECVTRLLPITVEQESPVDGEYIVWTATCTPDPWLVAGAHADRIELKSATLHCEARGDVAATVLPSTAPPSSRPSFRIRVPSGSCAGGVLHLELLLHGWTVNGPVTTPVSARVNVDTR